MTDDGIRGYLDTHSSDEIKANQINIDKWISSLNHYSSIMLKYALAFKSNVLQTHYMKSMVEELRIANNAQLDGYLFGPLSLAFQSSGINILNPESKKILTEYLKELHPKYSEKEIKSNPGDHHRGITAPYYSKVVEIMNK